MKDEEMADIWVKGHTEIIKDEELGMEYIKEPAPKDAFLAGLYIGLPQWHDLQENHNDLPKDIGIKLCYTRTAKYVCASYDEEYDCWGFVFNNLEHCMPSSVIIAWCEIPTFDKE